MGADPGTILRGTVPSAGADQDEAPGSAEVGESASATATQARTGKLRDVMRHWPNLAVPLSYALGAVILFANALRSPGSALAGSNPDAMQLTWFLARTAHALTHHQALFFSSALNAPAGVNLAWNTAMPLLGIVATPITLQWGPVVAYNLLICVAVATTAWAMYAAVMHFTGQRLVSWCAGVASGLSPFMIAQSLGHLDLVFMAYVATTMVLCDIILVGQHRPWWLAGGALGVITAAQLYIFQETVAAVVVAVAVALAVLLVVSRRAQVSARTPYARRAFALALVVALVVASPLLITQFAGAQHPSYYVEVSSNGLGSDLTALVIPTANQWLAPVAAQQVALHWMAQGTGQDAYLGIFALLLLGIAVAARRRDAAVRVLGITTVVLLILSLGPWLSVDGRNLPVPLPDIVLQHLPLVTDMVPLRWSFYAATCAILTVAIAIARQPAGRLRLVMVVLAMLTVVSWLPSLPRPLMPTPVPSALPSAVEARIPTGTTVLFVPCASASSAAGMYYQAIGGFRWSLVAGYAYYQSAASPVAAHLCAASSSAAQPQGAALERALGSEGVGVILVPPGATADAERIARATGQTPVVVDRFSLWVTGAT
jgi:hypothetical protein